ncbi:hypothetical protein [Natronobacterium gregoryi]|uniref:Uncharacterized protein n=2 Tax=Natronobacterium gregoryi TaxID=44930 RepID=L0AG55_NATGS|nr:hypothetical protein [Natronobacterium gregoryi]AFZ72117.1 hypothetical protein Natgr_0877 [Natronobacterium gregoryi SP2]PLK19279.1 hypothetical protein CYV19_15795 [Natronobacterium gregoryi SP2]SFJ55230.1 hypothetical protein SAMN05443661_13830 [Natronobacterium gregoryi]
MTASSDQIDDEREIDVELEGDTERSPEQLLADLLRLVREGRTRMDALADSLELSAVDTERLVAAAETQGDVMRAGYTGGDLYTIHLTEQGATKLPSRSIREVRLARHDLAERDLEVLRAVDAVGRCTATTVREHLDNALSPMELIPIVTHLVREDYLEESGWFRRYVELTPAGESVLEAIENES